MAAGMVVVAHRAGNDLGDLRAAEAMGVDLVEADLHLRAGRVEVRHLKVLWPLPLLWDRWYVADPFTPRLDLPTLLRAARPGTHLLLDLKGTAPRLARRTLEALADRPGPVSVCARNWRLLAPFAHVPGVRTIRSVATPRMLRRVLRETDPGPLSIDQRLLGGPVAAELAPRVPLLLAWGVDDPARLAELRDAGVGGVIASEPAVLRAALRGRGPRPPGIVTDALQVTRGAHRMEIA
jgi:glycerophosphoryl diester phosphodiesterase